MALRPTEPRLADRAFTITPLLNASMTNAT
jgi:hypothetical protein